MTPCKFRWQSVDPTRNRFRYYELAIDTDLWGNVILVYHWGRLGTNGQRQVNWPASEKRIATLLEKTAQVRALHGYTLRI